MASLPDLIGRGAELAEHGSTVAAREAQAAARAEELAARSARVAAAQKAESEAARMVELQRQMDVAHAAEQLRLQGRLNAAAAQSSAPAAAQAAPAAAQAAPAAAQAAPAAAQAAPAAQSRLGQIGGHLKDAVTGEWGSSLGGGLGEILGGNASIKSGLAGIGRLGHLSVTTPWALLGAGKLLEAGKNVARNGWSTLGNEMGIESSPEIVHKDEDKRRQKLNTEVMGGLTDWHAKDNETAYEMHNDEDVHKAIEAIPDDTYKTALSQIARGGDASNITNLIARNHSKTGTKWKPKGIVHLAGTIQSKGGQKFNLAINYDGDKPEIIHIPVSDDNNSHGGVHFGSLDEWDKKKSQSK